MFVGTLVYPVSFLGSRWDKVWSERRMLGLWRNGVLLSEEVCKCGKSSDHRAGGPVACQMDADDSVTDEELFCKDNDWSRCCSGTGARSWENRQKAGGRLLTFPPGFQSTAKSSNHPPCKTASPEPLFRD